MADETDQIKALIQTLVEQTADHVEIPAFIADVDALIAAVRAEDAQRLAECEKERAALAAELSS